MSADIIYFPGGYFLLYNTCKPSSGHSVGYMCVDREVVTAFISFNLNDLRSSQAYLQHKLPDMNDCAWFLLAPPNKLAINTGLICLIDSSNGIRVALYLPYLICGWT